ncbi:substance-K receptor-like [Acanthaster planci]|uniref:Substance-K receptor-like n=1 Tax=Acanthaster planci TaxID=133434 RepID=A0A8B7Y758_ACAPL|nr:substance-K receptor-like [Acanthaster planci]
MASYNTSDAMPEQDPGVNDAVNNALLDAINTIIACLAVLGNSMVISVMLLRPRVFSSFTNRLLLHQSVIDAVAGLLFLLFTVVREFPVVVSREGNEYDQLVCRVVHSAFLLWSVNVTSTYNLVIISLERFMATCYPVRHRNTWSRAKLKFALAASWLIGFLYGSHLLFIFEPRQGECQPVAMGVGLQVLFGAVVVGIEYLIPMSIMVYTYSRILTSLSMRPGNPVSGQPNSLSRAKRNVLVTVLLAAVMFAVCWIPSELTYLNAVFFGDTFGEQVYEASTGVLACNMFVNPVIYCFMYERFRVQLRGLIMRRFRGNRVANELSVTLSTEP